MKRLYLLLVAFAGLFCQPAVAVEATFCNTTNGGANTFTDKSVFVCGNGVRGTLAELYQQGWRVVAMDRFLQVNEYGLGTLLVEKGGRP